MLQAVKEEEEEWVATAPAAPSGCVVLVEGNPPPGAHMGHMSFNSFNPHLEKLQVSYAMLHLLNLVLPGLSDSTGYWYS